MRDALEAAAPAIRKQERERVREALLSDKAKAAAQRGILNAAYKEGTTPASAALSAALDTLGGESDG